MVSPVQDNIVGGAVEVLDDVAGGSGKIERLEVEVHQASVKILKPRDEVIAAHVVVRVSEHLDVWMQVFQGMLGVLWSVSGVSGPTGQLPYYRVHYNLLLVLPSLGAWVNSRVKA